MQLLHYTEIRDKIQRDLDLLDEGFITEDELLGYINEAIDDVEASIHTLYEDYFLTQATLSMVSGTDTYALPSNIYAAKIRKFLFVNGSIKYEIKRVRDLRETMFSQSGDDYSYILTNTEDVGYRIKIYPVPVDTVSLPLWHIRNAKRLTTSSSDVNNVCDIPEFVNFVIQHAKVRCYEKEMNPNTQKAMADLERLKLLTIETLTNMVPDEDTKVLMDTDFYYDFDRDVYHDGF